MLRPLRPSGLSGVLIAVILSMAGTSCKRGGTASAPPQTPATRDQVIAPAPLRDEDLAASVHRLLRDGAPSPARSALLGACVSRMLARAHVAFAEHQVDDAVASLTGGMYLVRSGEFRREMLAQSDATLAEAMAYFGPRGDEGRSLALLTMRGAIAPAGSTAARDAAAHLAALQGWLRDTHPMNTLQGLGREQRAQVDHALLEPSADALKLAEQVTLQWIEGGAKFEAQQRSAGTRMQREEAMEAFRVFRSGAVTLAALHLRHGDARGAFAAVEGSAARRKISPFFYERLERAATSGDAGSWRDLLSILLSPEQQTHESSGDPRDDPDFAVDPQLLRGAVWGAAVEAYRRDPAAMDVDMALASLLSQFGMPDVAPLVLTDGVVAHPDRERLGAALSVVLQTLVREDRAENIESVRRVFRGALTLLALGDRSDLRGQVQPSSAQLRFLMGTLETKAGNLSVSRSLLELSARQEPSLDAYLALANIDRQGRRFPQALDEIQRGLATEEAHREPAAAIEGHLLAAEIARDSGDAERARKELATALHGALEARQHGGVIHKSRAERLLARILDRYGETAGAARATERAFSHAVGDRQQVAAVVLDTTSRAFLRKDVKAARNAVDRGIAADLRDDDLVYAALFLMLTERSAKTTADGKVIRALQSIGDLSHWSGQLASWGLGKVKDDALLGLARTAGQKTEAAFYTAAARWVAGEVAASTSQLREVATSATVDLVEVQLAREMLSPTPPVGPLPTTTKLP